MSCTRFQKYKNGFYVYAKPTLTDPSTVSQYISRYLGRPVIGLSRIDSYDGESVTFHYNRHEDNVYVEKTLPAIDFINLLIQHIPEKHFKMTRYYGLYARNRELDKPLNRLVPKAIEELREKYIKNPPEGMTAKLVKNMSDSDLLDMHYFLTEDEDFDGEEEGFYIDLF